MFDAHIYCSKPTSIFVLVLVFATGHTGELTLRTTPLRHMGASARTFEGPRKVFVPFSLPDICLLPARALSVSSCRLLHDQLALRHFVYAALCCQLSQTPGDNFANVMLTIFGYHTTYCVSPPSPLRLSRLIAVQGMLEGRVWLLQRDLHRDRLFRLLQ